MECKLLVCAQNIIIDFQTKRISAIQVYEDIRVNSFPIAIPVSICTILQKSPEEPNNPNIIMEIKLEKNVLLRTGVDAVFVENFNLTKNISTIGPLVISFPGKLTFNLCHETDDNIIGKYDFNVTTVPQTITAVQEETTLPTVTD